jgi:hypothetical protein
VHGCPLTRQCEDKPKSKRKKEEILPPRGSSTIQIIYFLTEEALIAEHSSQTPGQ